MDSSLDVLGQAWLDHWRQGRAAPLWLHTSYDEETEEMPIDYFFRAPAHFPEIEQYALSMCRGKVLDVGAGTGVHASYLQQQGQRVTTLEISTAGVHIQRERGLHQVVHGDYHDYEGRGFDTVLLLMNGVGVCGTIAGLHSLLRQAQRWLSPAGQLIFDSSDVAYLYEGALPTGAYYGELRYRYEYRGQRGRWFPWLYVDIDTLETIALSEGWRVQKVFQDEQDQYLACLTLV